MRWGQWLCFAVIVSAGEPRGLQAQTPQVPFTSFIQDLRDREYAPVRRDLEAAAELMPDSLYAFRPGAGLRTFGEEIDHAAAVNQRLCGMAMIGTGATAPPRPAPGTPPPPTDKPTALRRLRDSFTQCDGVMAGLTDQAALAPTVGPYMRVSHLIAMVGHTSQMHGRVALMLRLKGLVPPSTAARQLAR